MAEASDETLWNVEDTRNPARFRGCPDPHSRLQSAGGEPRPFHGYGRRKCLPGCSTPGSSSQAKADAASVANAESPNRFPRVSATRRRAQFSAGATWPRGNPGKAQDRSAQAEKPVIKTLI